MGPAGFAMAPTAATATAPDDDDDDDTDETMMMMMMMMMMMICTHLQECQAEGGNDEGGLVWFDLICTHLEERQAEGEDKTCIHQVHNENQVDPPAVSGKEARHGGQSMQK